MQKLNLSKQLIEQIVNKILEEIKAEKIVVFGSQVRDDHRKSSDIDIALFGVKKKGFFLLKDRLNEELNTLRDVDMEYVGVAIAVSDAVPEILKIAHLITSCKSGFGAAREVTDWILTAQGEK